MKTTLSFKLNIAFLVLISIGFAACSKMDDTYKGFLEGGELRYSKKPDTIGVYPGHNRAKVWLAVSATNVSKAKIYWNNRLDSIEIPIVRASKTDTVSTIIDNLEEGSYEFEYILYDDKGNSSLPIDTVGRIFGDSYISSIHSRIADKVALLNNNVKILWLNETGRDAIGSEVEYKSKDGKPFSVNVPIDQAETNITPGPLKGSIKYRSLFLPHPNAIDTFYTEYITLIPDAIYEGFPETFEDTQYVKPKSAPATITIGSGLWLFDEFLIGTAGADRKNGDRSVRSNKTKTSILEMKYDLPDGISKISFYHAICSSDDISTFKVQGSRDGGLSWEDVSEIYTNTSIDLAHKEILLDWAGPVRIRFYKFSATEDSNSTGRMNIDDIDIYPN